MALNLETFVFPADWACAFMYGDDSGLDAKSIAAIDEIERENMSTGTFVCVDVEGADMDCDFRSWHDASHVYPLAANVARFTFDLGGAA